MESDNPLIKELLDKTTLRSLDPYDVIGFDVDHTLVQYNIPNLHKMAYNVLADLLIKDRGYPTCIKEITEEQLNFPLNALVCDFKTGCFLKLGEDNVVLRAYHGFHRLTTDEVSKMSNLG